MAFLVEHTSSGKVRKSQSTARASILFVRKKNSSVQLCVNFQDLNKITILNQYLLLLINELRKKTQGSQWFTKFDLKNSYHLIQVKEGIK